MALCMWGCSFGWQPLRNDKGLKRNGRRLRQWSAGSPLPQRGSPRQPWRRAPWSESGAQCKLCHPACILRQARRRQRRKRRSSRNCTGFPVTHTVWQRDEICPRLSFPPTLLATRTLHTHTRTPTHTHSLQPRLSAMLASQAQRALQRTLLSAPSASAAIASSQRLLSVSHAALQSDEGRSREKVGHERDVRPRHFRLSNQEHPLYVDRDKDGKPGPCRSHCGRRRSGGWETAQREFTLPLSVCVARECPSEGERAAEEEMEGDGKERSHTTTERSLFVLLSPSLLFPTSWLARPSAYL